MFIPLTLLAIELSSVIAMRTMRLMSGGVAATHEARLMVSEKMDAAFEAMASLIGRRLGRSNN